MNWILKKIFDLKRISNIYALEILKKFDLMLLRKKKKSQRIPHVI